VLKVVSKVLVLRFFAQTGLLAKTRQCTITTSRKGACQNYGMAIEVTMKMMSFIGGGRDDRLHTGLCLNTRGDCAVLLIASLLPLIVVIRIL
jgi:hypothetical protein